MKVELVAKTQPLVEGVSTAEFAAYVARIGKVKDILEDVLNLHFNAAYGNYDELGEIKERIEQVLKEWDEDGDS